MRLLIIVLTLVYVASCKVARKENTKPNIIVILADDLGYGDVSCYNKEAKVKTPVLCKYYFGHKTLGLISTKKENFYNFWGKKIDLKFISR